MIDHPAFRPVDPEAKPAVETTKVELNGDEWVDLGPGPLLVGTSKGDNVVYSVSDNLPRHPIREGFVLLAGVPMEIHTSAHVYAMSRDHHHTVVFAVHI